MEGLIPFLYKAIVMYKREGSFSSVLLSDHHSPSNTGYYMRLPGDSSGRFRTSDRRRFGTDRLGLLETTPSSSPSRVSTRSMITKRT
ncbi:hypothetical protein ISN45_Aa06g001230 [Arabidopsis thaliana x Arabidopsis arenosa]|uniref:Uncharacterized protein n=1 Tax=Arabidopsis thaliana x Arabidopsis arenosa TaxID=1240361 RepID=A0A8T1YRX7_9BRAS|nr:hypothetical protein ISN45_Aa06g001230 [Arabidopsis thaliana x Arabidopsis arenosa]